MKIKNLFATFLTLTFVTFTYAASDTTSSIRGVITGPDGDPVANASVTVVHEPSGSTVSKSSNAQGVFIANNLRVGGPYKLTVVSAYGSQSVSDIYTKLSQTFSANLVLEQSENVVTVGAKTNFNETFKTGARSNLSSEDLSSISSITRGLKDAVATVPFVNVYSMSFEDDDQEGFTIAGQNPRYSTFSVDGVSQNDDFGLEKQGYPTIQSPISLDALEQVTVTVTDYDVRYSGTSAGNINAVTKSGTNEFKGSVFYYTQDDSLRGDSVEGKKLSLSTYEEETFGFTFGGPIIKDKLFFFVNVDDFEKIQPGRYGAAGTGAPEEVDNVSIAQAQQVVDIANAVYDYDAGGYSGLPSTLIDEDRLAKLDWNINDNHRATYTHQESTNNIASEYGSSRNILSLTSGGFLKTTSLEVDTVQLFSDWSDTFSTNLKVSEKGTRQRNDNVGGSEFMRATILLEGDDNGPQILLGPDPFRHANSLTTDTRNIELEFNKLVGIHEIVGGYSQKQVDTFNEFIAYSDVEQIYDSIDDFESKTPSSIDYRNAPSGDAIDGAAVYQKEDFAFYIQDTMYFPEFADTGDLTVILGLRKEGVNMPNSPRENPELIKAHGFSNATSLNGKTNWLPRASFILELNDDISIFQSPTLRGGVGMFAGARPMVWVSGTYSNDGIGIQNANVPLSAATGFDGFDQSVYNQYIYQIGDSQYTPAFADVLDRNFKLPKDLKISFGMDWVFGKDYYMTADFIYQDVKEDIHWEAMRLGNPYFSGNAAFDKFANCNGQNTPFISNTPIGSFPDGRDAYIASYANNCGKYTQQDFFDDMGYDVYVTNTQKGDSKLFALSMEKEFDNGWDVRTNYTYSDVTTVGGQTSSRNISNYKYTTHYADFNEDIAVRSAFSREHSASIVANYDAYHFDGLKTSYTFALNYSSGEPFSYVYDNYKDCALWGLDTESCRPGGVALYVPSNPATSYSDGVDMVVQSSYYDEFMSILDQTGLSAYAGEFAPINEFEGSANTQLDFKFIQELPGLGLTDGDKFILSLDVQNILNLLNDEWGVMVKGYDSSTPLIEVEPRQAEDGTLYYYGKEPYYSPRLGDKTSYYRSLYKIQLGFRYHF